MDSTLWKGWTIDSKSCLWEGDMLVPWRVGIIVNWLLDEDGKGNHLPTPNPQFVWCIHPLIYHSKKQMPPFTVGSNISSAPHWSWSMGYSSEISHGSWKSPIRKGKTSSKSSFFGFHVSFRGRTLHPSHFHAPEVLCWIDILQHWIDIYEGISNRSKVRFLYRPRWLEDAPRSCKLYMFFFVDATFVVNLCVCFFLSIHFSSPGLIVIL